MMIVVSDKELTDVNKEVTTSLTCTNEERRRCAISNATVKSCESSDAFPSRELGKTFPLKSQKLFIVYQLNYY